MSDAAVPFVLMAVGDVLIERPDPETAFEPALDVLHACDVLFGNCEAVYSHRPARAPSASIPVIPPPENVVGLAPAGFDVMSLANNHTVDGGHEALLDTIAALEGLGIATCGAGASAEAARAPAIVERAGTRVATLAYCANAVHPAGYDARDDVPGISSIRIHTVYYPSDLAAFQSGGAPDQFTVVNPVDLRRIRAEIREAAKVADVVLVSIHAGDGTGPAKLLDYEHQLAEAAVDAGADVVVGHHHHMLRGVELRRGRPIFYGLGHFVFDVPDLEGQVGSAVMARMTEHAGEYAYGGREGWPLLPMHPDARMTGVAIVEIADHRIRAGILPCMLNPAGQPVPAELNSPEWLAIEAYLERLNREEGLAANWSRGTTAAGLPLLVATPPRESR